MIVMILYYGDDDDGDGGHHPAPVVPCLVVPCAPARMTYDCLLEREAWLGGGGIPWGGGLRRGDAAPYTYIYIHTCTHI